jgi:hypothetical protein
MTRLKTLSMLTLLMLMCTSTTAFAQYNDVAGKSSAPASKMVEVERQLKDGRTVKEKREVTVKRDSYGNAADSSYDLAVDGAFEGQTIVVWQQYSFSFDNARDALKKKGFSVYRFNSTPSPAELKKALKKANQFWLISSDQRLMNDEHAKIIKDFFDAGHGVYIWGDNEPYYADANYLSSALLDASMKGDIMGDQTVSLKSRGDKTGLLEDHLMSTGIETIYEGITIATIQPNDHLTPFLWGSAGNLVASLYDKDRKRAILDGGFTRLYNKWDTAGTGRYVVNAAAWLANYERFGDDVLADGLKKETRTRERQEKSKKSQ